MIFEKILSLKTKLSKNVLFLCIASCLMIFSFLGNREIWTQEHRWAEIVAGMFYRSDFFHPFWGEHYYYDKPLLSYWVIAVFVKLAGDLTTWTLRLPSAIAGIVSILSIYKLGSVLKDRHYGLLSAWMLLTTYYFIFWARVSSADSLNLAGILLAITWYFYKKEHPKSKDYVIFFIIVALTSLCKGLVGLIMPLIAVSVDLSLNKSWHKHFTLKFLLSVIPGLCFYLVPFILSSFIPLEHNQQNGLYLVYRENIVRYFHPFDHREKFYLYFYYLPLYTLPWSIFLIPTFFYLKNHWKILSVNSKWIFYCALASFLFFSLSGSRRSYYILPVVPFVILLMADFLSQERKWHYQKTQIKQRLAMKSKFCSHKALYTAEFSKLMINLNRTMQ